MAFTDLGNGVVRVCVNRPKKMNALSSEVIAGIVSDFKAACADTTTRVIIFRGVPVEGKYLAPLAGADLAGLVNAADEKSIPTDSAREHMQEGIDGILAIRKLCLRENVLHNGDEAGRVIVIGMVDGPCLAGGIEYMFGVSDIVIASDRSVFGMREIGLAGMGGWRGPQLLRERLGSPLLVNEMVLGLGITYRNKRGLDDLELRFGDIDALTALNRGLINYIIEHDQIGATVRSMAQHAATLDRMAVTFNLEVAEQPVDEDCTDLATDLMVELMGRSAWVEKVCGFLDKQK